MNLNIVFIVVAGLGFVGTVVSLALLIAAAKQKRPVKKLSTGLVAGLLLLAAGLGGYILWMQQNKTAPAQVYSNPDFGISLNYPTGWTKIMDSMNLAFPNLPIDTTSTVYLPGDGSSQSFGLNSFGGSFVLSAPPGQKNIVVYRNTGNDANPVWAALTVGVQGVDAPGSKECLWSADNGTLIFTPAPPLLSHAIRIDYAVTGWSALVGFESPDRKCFVVLDISRLAHGQSFSAWSQTWQNSAKTDAGKPPYYEQFISSGAAQLAGLAGLEKTYTDNQAGGRQCTDFAVPANGWAYEVQTSTVNPAKYSDWQSTIKKMLASINITAPVPSQ